MLRQAKEFDVEHFRKNELFEGALPPVDYELEEDAEEPTNHFDKVFIGKLTDSIKGGGELSLRKVGEGGEAMAAQNGGQNGQVGPMPRRFIYRAGGGIFVEQNERGRAEEGAGTAEVQQRGRYEPNGEFVADQRLCPIGETPIMPRAMSVAVPSDNGQFRSKRNFYDTPQIGQRQQQFDHFQKHQQINESVECSRDYYVPMKREFGKTVGYEGTDRTASIQNGTFGDGIEWVAESEQTLDSLFSVPANKTHKTALSNEQSVGSSTETRSKSRELDSNGIGGFETEMGGIARKGGKGAKGNALTYAEQPFELTLRRDVFMFGEVLDDVLEIDLVFCQVCLISNNYIINR